MVPRSHPVPIIAQRCLIAFHVIVTMAMTGVCIAQRLHYTGTPIKLLGQAFPG